MSDLAISVIVLQLQQILKMSYLNFFEHLFLTI